MGASFSGDDELIANINITPFVDIILVVLIIFMVTATTITQQAILVKLPEAATGESAGTTSLGLTLLATGELLLDGAQVTPEALRTRIREAMAAEEKVVCLIAADELVAHGRVVWLLDLVKSEGVTSFAINIDPASAIPPDPASLGKGRGADPTNLPSP